MQTLKGTPQFQLGDFYDPAKIKPLEGARVLVLVNGKAHDAHHYDNRIQPAYYREGRISFVQPQVATDSRYHVHIENPIIAGWLPWPEFTDG